MIKVMIYIGDDEKLKGKEAEMKSSPHLLHGWALFRFPGETKFRPMLVQDFTEPSCSAPSINDLRRHEDL